MDALKSIVVAMRATAVRILVISRTFRGPSAAAPALTTGPIDPKQSQRYGRPKTWTVPEPEPE